MESKICTKCNVEKDIKDYYKSRLKYKGTVRPYYYSKCKKCFNKVNSDSRKKHIEKTKAKNKEWRKNNPEKIKKYTKNYALNNKEQKKISWKKWYEKNRERNILRTKARYKEKKQEINTKKNISEKNRRKVDYMFRFKHNLRVRIGEVFRLNHVTKSKRTEMILGCSFDVAKKYIERKFTKGMTWENHGKGKDKWHIDHKIPLSIAKTENEIIALCHYTNLQPMWSSDNLSKGDRILPIQMTLNI